MIRWRSSLLLALVLATPVLADPSSPSQLARALADGQAAPQDVLAQLGEQGVAPSRAIELLRQVRLPAGKAGATRFALEDPHGRKTEVLVSVPAAPRPDGRYGVLLVLHGLGGNAQQLMDFARRIAPAGTIVAAPGAQRLDPALENDDVPKLGRRALLQHWWRYHREGFPLLALRQLKRTYPVDTDRVLLVGYSMGGYGTWGTGLRFPDVFAGIAPLAGGVSRLENFVARDAKVRPLLANARGLPSFFVHGDSDGVVPVRFSRTVHEELSQLGAEHVYEEVPGGQHILMGFLRGDALTHKLTAWLAERRREPWPKTLEHTALGTYAGRRAWLRVDELQGQRAHVVAQVEGNEVKLSGEGVRELTLFLGPELLDLSRPVRVTWGERVLYSGTVASGLDAVRESWRDAEDPALLAPAMLHLAIEAAPEATKAPAAEAPAPKAPVKAPTKAWFQLR
ncbi:MAG: alpha/beta hydrolase-fold protein [Planctomycetota bacterium]